MNNQLGIQKRVTAAFAAVAVSAICVLGTVGPVQAGGSTAPVQTAQITAPHGAA